MFSAEPIFALLGRAIDAAALKQAVHVANIANADAEGYHRLEVEMQAALQPSGDALSINGLAGNGLTSATESVGESWDALQPRVVRAANDTVRLDQEMALMAKDAVRYQALIGAFERTIGTLRAAVKEGRE